MNDGAAALEVDVISDVVCPWCFIGERHLAAAAATLRRDGAAIRVRWHPYLLDPDTPPAGEPYRPYLEHKFGGAAAVEALWQRVREAGKRGGVDFAFEKIARRPSTIDAHRAIRRAGAEGDAGPLVDALFVAHFQRGEDIGDRRRLAKIAAATSGDDAERWFVYLDSAADTDAVREEAAAAGRSGIHGVPFFIFNQRLAVSGAQPADALVSAMREAMPRT